MRIYFSLFLISYFVLISCSSSDKMDYPLEIEKKGLESKYDNAKFEIYLLYLSCLPNEKKTDLLSYDIDFFGIDTVASSTTILFESPEILRLIQQTDCYYFTGIGYDNSGNINLQFIGECAAFNYIGLNLNLKNEIIKNEILHYRKELNLGY
ncbi:MAG: hypothetical protein R2771_16420 [Saprospiraceae bacterium]